MRGQHTYASRNPSPSCPARSRLRSCGFPFSALPHACRLFSSAALIDLISFVCCACNTFSQLHHRSSRQRAWCHQEEVSTMRRSYMLRVSVKMILSALASPRQFSFVFLKLRVSRRKQSRWRGVPPTSLAFLMPPDKQLEQGRVRRSVKRQLPCCRKGM